jgi:class 3 adenylate cyclase
VAPSGHVTGVEGDPLERSGRRRRALLRIGVPMAGVVLVIGTILAIGLYTFRANERSVLALSDDLLAGLDQRIAAEVSAHLDPADRMLRLARDVVGPGAATERQEQAIAFATSALRVVPQIAQFSFADTDGNYVLVRPGADGGTEVKVIRNTPPPRQVVWITRDKAGHEVSRREDPADDFDPRTRPWFSGAPASGDASWTDVYVFFTDRVPGVTIARRGAGAAASDVFAADLRLDALSQFLAGLRIGRTGRAMIIDGAGQLVAYPDPARILRTEGGKPVQVRLDGLDDAVLAAAWDRLRIEGPGRRVVDVGGQREILIVTPLPRSGRDWSVLIAVPETEFAGFLRNNGSRALVMSLVVVALTAALAALLVRQGLRADRTERALLDRSEAILRQSAAFSRLAAEADLFDPAGAEPPRALTETLAEVTGARRASLWRITDGGASLRCEDSFEPETGGHVSGLVLSRHELPNFLQHLLHGEEIAAEDAVRDPRTSELHRLLMHELGSRALLTMPVRRGERVTGAICLEDAADTTANRDFTRAVANMVALRMTEIEASRPVPQITQAGPVTSEGERSLAAELALRGFDPDTIAAEVYSDVAVMVLRFADPASLAAPDGKNGSALADRVACILQEIAAGRDIPYVKLVGQVLVAASGFRAGDSGATARIAEMALAARDRCAALFEDAGLPPAFHIGIDCGLAIGSAVGRGPRIFNLWGDAVRSADELASSAPAAMVQVTEATYRALSHGFLFRPRGSFYIPHVGATRTFILAGQL